MQTIKHPDRKPPTTIPAERKTHDTELIDDMDALLDEIDGLLEEQDFLVNYRQKGGE